MDTDRRETGTDLEGRFRILELLSMSWLSSAIVAIWQLGVSDVLDRPRSVGWIAAAIKADEASLYRLLRAAASYGVFEEVEPRVFASTPASEVLRGDHPGAVGAIAEMAAADWHLESWKRLGDAVRVGESAFDLTFGEGLFDYITHNPSAGATFHAAMTAYQRLAHEALLGAYDFSSFACLVDVGGSYGELAGAIAARTTGLRVVLFDRPEVISKAREQQALIALAPRVEFVAGDFFDRVPGGADAYLLSTILHDWGDADARQILRSCRRAMPRSARLLIAERVIPPGNEPFFGKLMDLEMIALSGGMERTKREFAELLASADLSLNRVVETATPMSLLEALPV